MNHASWIISAKSRRLALIALVLGVAILVISEIVGYVVQRSGGRVQVSNVTFQNFNGILVRAKLLRPSDSGAAYPGVVYIHGYQNNRETSDAYCIELARRGFVVLEIDAIGRGNSGNPNDPKDPDFDGTYGAKSALQYLRGLPFVKKEATGMMGHSLGAEMAYTLALQDATIQALSVSGFAYTDAANLQQPKNMLMIFGKYDEYRGRMTGTRNFEKEWMLSPQTKKVIDAPNPQFSTTYGDFAKGTARRVYMPYVTHVQESHNPGAIAEALNWMRAALNPPESLWIPAEQQIWENKEAATLVAMLSGIWLILPLAVLFLNIPWFRPLVAPAQSGYWCTARDRLRYAAINGLLMWLYLPLIMVMFAIHVYVIPIDKAFPMMMVNGTVWWFLCINIIGFFILRGWLNKQQKIGIVSWSDLGVPEQNGKVVIDLKEIGRTLGFAGLIFLVVYGLEHLLEAVFLIDYRFIFPFANDLTPYRVGMMFLYFPFLLIGFIQMGLFLHGQIKIKPRKGLISTFLAASGVNILVMVIPIILMLAVQYIPLLAGGTLPFVGPGGVMATFMINLFHIIGVLVIVLPVSTWLNLLTGKIAPGAVVNALLVAWMFASSQVIAPIPV
ncbi:MAG TPA: CocE/NonD family hydrolase [Anaerolineaceae bacterium]